MAPIIGRLPTLIFSRHSLGNLRRAGLFRTLIPKSRHGDWNPYTLAKEIHGIGFATAEAASDFHFIERETPEGIAATLVKLVQDRMPKGTTSTGSATSKSCAR